MGDPPPNRDKTLGGVQRTKFAPNLAARRNKKESSGPHKLHRLLAEGRDSQPAGPSGSSAPADRYGVRSPPPGDRGRGRGASDHGGRGGGRGSGGGGSGAGGSSHAASRCGGDSSGDVPMPPVKLDTSDSDSRPPSRATRPPSRSWLEMPDAPLALPLLKSPPRYRPGSSASGRGTPGSRPASRAAGGRWEFPHGSAAATLLGGGAEAAPGAAPSVVPDQLFFVHLPSALPVRPSSAKAPTAPPVSGAEYMAALSRGDGDNEGGGRACGFGVGGGSFRGGGAAEGAPPLATLEEMEAGRQGELLVYKSGKVVWSLDGFLLELQPGAPCSFEQEIVAMRNANQPSAGTPSAGGKALASSGKALVWSTGASAAAQASTEPMHLYRLGRMAHRLVVAPDVPSLLHRCSEERAAHTAAHQTAGA